MNTTSKDDLPPQPKGVQLVYSNEFYRNLCIICQKNEKKGKKPACKASKLGIDSLKRAAKARNDDNIKKRIKIVETENIPLIYHNSNECFKRYTHKRDIESLEKAKNVELMNIDESLDQPNTEVCKEVNVMLRRSSTTPREKPYYLTREKKRIPNIKNVCFVCRCVYG